MINDQKYGNQGNPPPNTNLPIGSVEEWELSNPSGAHHPFHIHVNPFQVVGEKIDPTGPNEPSNWMWRDTVAIQRNTPEDNPLKIRFRFLNFHGKFVFHCHILIHEDQGMMQDVTVTGEGYGPGEEVTKCQV